MMPFSRVSVAVGPLPGAIGRRVGAQNLAFSPTRFHEDPKYLTRHLPVRMRHFIVLQMYDLIKLSRAPECSTAVCLRHASA